ncbi:MAG: UbiD family decarboxylase [Betaproteobacteria bacterium]|nr:UbiD family decarboxylase [Betaproteobacteria bacterium]
MTSPMPTSLPANSGENSAGEARDLRKWLALIESRGELLTIDAEVDPEEELTAITFMATQRRGCQALLFRNLKGDASGSRILINMLGASKERYGLAVGLDPGLSTREMITATRQVLKRRIAPTMVGSDQAPVSEVVLTEGKIDLTRFPVPRFWPGDGGKYFGTGSIVLTRNPETGVLNAGVYRLQLHAANMLGFSLVPGRHGLRNCEAWWSRGHPAEVVVALGIDPALFIAATQSFDYGESELDIAGGFLGAPVQLTRAKYLDLPIPAQAEFVIEGLVHKDRLEPEGPLGEWHGFYSSPSGRKPVIDVKAIHHRRSPILTAALMANYPSCEIGAYHAIARSSRICDNLESMGIPGITGAYAHPGAANAYGLVVIALKQLYPGHASQVLALAAQCPASAYCTKWIIAVDDDVDPTDIDEVMWAMTTRANPSDDIDVLRNTWTNRNDQSLAPDARPYGSKALINACMPHKYISVSPPRTFLRKSTYDRVVERWAEFALPDRPPVLNNFHKE